MSRAVEMMGQCFHGQYKGRTTHKSIVSPFPIKQEVRLPVEDFGRRTNFSLAWPTHPYIQSHWVRKHTCLVRFVQVFMSRIIMTLSSCVRTPSEYTAYTCFAVTMNQSGETKRAILWLSGNRRRASFLDRDSETHSASAEICIFTKPRDSAAYVKTSRNNGPSTAYIYLLESLATTLLTSSWLFL